jgi:membrane-bound lytic murein transglycosylase B
MTIMSGLSLTRLRPIAVALVVAGSLLPAAAISAAGSDDSSGEAQHMAAQLASAAAGVLDAQAAVGRLKAQPAPAVAIDQVRADLAGAQAAYTFRDAIRREQALVYELAGRTDIEPATLALLKGPGSAGMASADQALRALWRLSGFGVGRSVGPRYSKRYAGAEPVDNLLGYYRAAAARSGIDWTYLAAINYIESDFGRNNGPSSAGALGPMQFLPTTFHEYGGDGDVMSPHDSIQAAAALLARNGAPADYDRALLRYNHSQDYVAAVAAYAAAIRGDTLWLTRFYYWSTYG